MWSDIPVEGLDHHPTSEYGSSEYDPLQEENHSSESP